MKFPRTYHLPWSPGRGDTDDKIHSYKTIEQCLVNQPIVITEKLDGENQCWSSSSWHLRSESSTNGGVLRSRSKSKWAAVKDKLLPYHFYYIEDLSNVHSIKYEDTDRLKANPLFLIAACEVTASEVLWKSYNFLMDEAMRLDLEIVPILDMKAKFSTVKELQSYTNYKANLPSCLGGQREGLVVTPYDLGWQWPEAACKWVRANHVTTDQHWHTLALAARSLVA